MNLRMFNISKGCRIRSDVVSKWEKKETKSSGSGDAANEMDCTRLPETKTCKPAMSSR
jgi:hypothetical protein